MLLPAHAAESVSPLSRPSTEGPGQRAGRFLSGPGLLVFLFTGLAGYEAFLLLTIFGPTEGGWLGDFVRDFQLWCYRGDPRTGGVSWLAVSVMMGEPLFVVGIAALLWRGVLTRLRSPRIWLEHRRAVGAALLIIAGGVAGLVYYARTDAIKASILPPFPGESIRVRLDLPEIELLDQKGEVFHFADLRGRVVLVTGVYATCTTACPEIFLELRKILDELPPVERAGLSVVAMSLNPEYETAPLMDAIASGRGFSHPEFRYVNGRQPAEMHDVLTRLQFSATRNPQNGVIDHANLFLLVDRTGHIAYRFTMDPRHRAWLRTGLRELLTESHADTPRTSGR